MLFNNIDEIKELTGFLYAYNNFDNLKTDIELAEEDMEKLIGEDMFAIAQDHYDTPPAEVNALLDMFLKRLQLPIAYFAIHSFSQNSDISHEDSGRKVKIDAEREKLPWQWMLDKDERAIINKANRTTDRLIAFLEKNIDETDFADWKTSTERTAIRAQFIADAETFDSIYPIDKSRRFFLKISPFIREAERKYILPVLTQTVFDSIKTSLADPDSPLIEPTGVLPYIQVPLAFFSMAIAVERLNIEILPEGVFQNVVSSTLTQNGKDKVDQQTKFAYAKLLEQRAAAELHFLQEFIRKGTEGTGYVEHDLSQGLDEDNQFARL